MAQKKTPEDTFLEDLTPEKIQELAEMLTRLVMESTHISHRPETGQGIGIKIIEKTTEEVKKMIEEVADAKRWMRRLDPIIHEFLAEWAVSDDLDNTSDRDKLMQAITKSFPSLDPLHELHALRLVIVHWVTHGRFKNVKEETQIKIVTEMLQVVTASLEYLCWRVRTTTPAKENQH